MAIELQPNGYYAMTDVERKSILEEMEKEYNTSLDVTRGVRRRWWLVERYLEGDQWASQGETGWTFLSVVNNAVLNQNAGEVNVDENIVVDNLMLRIHMTNTARLCRYKPQLEISPNEKSKEHNVAVRKGRIALYDLLYKSNWTRLQQSFARHLNVMGITFMKVAYDPSAGKNVRYPRLDENGEPAKDANGEQLYDYKPEGEVRIYAVNPKNLQFPLSCISLDDADWVQESNVRSVDYVKRFYDVVVKPEPINAYEWGRAGLGAPNQTTNEMEKTQQGQNSVILKERWYRPCAKYPQGAIIVWVKDQLISCKSLKKWYPDVPYFCAWNVFNDETIYADCPAYHLVQHQNEVNRTESNIARHVNLIGKPKLMLNKDMGVSDKAFNTNTGEIVEYSDQGNTKGVPASWLLAPPVSQSLYEHVNRHVDRMMVIGYAQDIQRPGHSRSGNAIAYEQEIDENTMAPMVDGLTSMTEKGLSFALKLMARYYAIPRMVKMLDSNRWTIEREFVGKDLFGNFDVRVNFLAGLPANKLARNQFIRGLYKDGLMKRSVAQKYLETGEEEDAIQAEAMEMEVVEQSIKLMEDGKAVPYHDYDNHPLMAESITRWLRENGLFADPKLVSRFEEKLSLHNQAIAVMNHPANAEDAGGQAALGGPAGAEPEDGGPGLDTGEEPDEMGGAPSVQEASAQPGPADLALQG